MKAWRATRLKGDWPDLPGPAGSCKPWDRAAAHRLRSAAVERRRRMVIGRFAGGMAGGMRKWVVCGTAAGGTA